MPKMILFDYGNTLIHEDVKRTSDNFIEIFESLNGNPRNMTLEQIYEEFWRLTREAIARYHPENIEYRYVDIFKLIFEKYGLKSTLTYEEMTEIFFDNYAAPWPSKGAVETLEYLVANKIRIGVLSNLSFPEEVLSRRLKKVLGVDMEMVIASGEWIFRKPSEEIFQVAIGKAGLRPEDIWYVGDNPYCDMLGAYQVGMKPIYYNSGIENVFLRDHEDIEMDFPVVEISDLREIIDMLGSNYEF